MYIPFDQSEKEKKLRWVVDTCQRSMQERISLYDRRRRYYLFGAYGNERVLYNRLFAHTDLVASFLYAADKVRFTVAAPRNSDEEVVAQIKAIEEDWNDEFRDCGMAYAFVDALQWALCFDSMLLKIGWNSARDELGAYMIPPHKFAVFDETECELDAQEAFVHTYSLPWENACMRLMRAGKRDMIPRLDAVSGPQSSMFPPVLANMIIASTGGVNLGGPMVGQVNPNYEPTATYEPKGDAPVVNFHEIWVWDDIEEDYSMFVLAEPDILIEDSREVIAGLLKGKKDTKPRKPKKGDEEDAPVKYASKTNYFLPGEHPFVHVRPFSMLDYFWGECHTERLIKLQQWTNRRLDQIHEILEVQADPAKVFSGFTGLTDEKAGALGGPGTWVSDMLPGAKVDRLSPEMPEDLFAELTAIGQLFLEASGLTETVMGRGEQGVRGKGHAKQLATTGSGRIRKIAVGLEQPLVQMGDVGLKLKVSKDPTRLRTNAGNEFVPAQVDTRWKMRVSGHSHSPLFADEERELATLLIKVGAIDREMLIRMLHPPQEAAMLHSLRKRMVGEKQAAMLKAQQPGKPNGAGKPAG